MKCFVLPISVLYFSYHFTGLILDFIKICISILSSKFIFVSEWNMNILKYEIIEANFQNYLFLNVFFFKKYHGFRPI